MIDALMKIAMQNVNVFLAKHGVLSTFSPNVLMNEPSIKCDKHLKCVFGEHGQAHLDCTKTNNTVE